jgi:hypothetical protein
MHTMRLFFRVRKTSILGFHSRSFISLLKSWTYHNHRYFISSSGILNSGSVCEGKERNELLINSASGSRVGVVFCIENSHWLQYVFCPSSIFWAAGKDLALYWTISMSNYFYEAFVVSPLFIFGEISWTPQRSRYMFTFAKSLIGKNVSHSLY